MRGGVSHPTGRKPRLEPSALPFFLAFLPLVRSDGLDCGWHNDIVYFGFCHILIPLAFKSSFFGLFSIMFIKIQFKMKTRSGFSLVNGLWTFSPNHEHFPAFRTEGVIPEFHSLRMSESERR